MGICFTYIYISGGDLLLREGGREALNVRVRERERVREGEDEREGEGERERERKNRNENRNHSGLVAHLRTCLNFWMAFPEHIRQMLVMQCLWQAAREPAGGFGGTTNGEGRKMEQDALNIEVDAQD